MKNESLTIIEKALAKARTKAGGPAVMPDEPDIETAPVEEPETEPAPGRTPHREPRHPNPFRPHIEPATTPAPKAKA